MPHASVRIITLGCMRHSGLSLVHNAAINARGHHVAASFLIMDTDAGAAKLPVLPFLWTMVASLMVKPPQAILAYLHSNSRLDPLVRCQMLLPDKQVQQ